MSTQLPRLLKPDNTALLVVDMQEKFAQAIPTFGQIQHRIQTLLKACEILKIPVVVSEQYPKGLGHTSAALQQSFPPDTSVFEKLAFGCGEDDSILECLQGLGRQQIMLCGIEAHVCVNQTAHQLLQAGYDVHLIRDAIDSRQPSDREAAVAKMQQSGVISSSIEIALFELLQKASHPDFKAIQALIK